MRVARIVIKNVLGIQALEIEPSPTGLTVLAGPNATGKTSALSAIHAALKERGAHEASLLRNGSTEGEVVLILDDGTEVKKRITPTASSITLRKPEVGRVGSPGRVLDSILQVESFDMISFIKDTPAKRIEALARAFPVEIPAEFWALATQLVPEANLIRSSGAHPLMKIAAVEAAVYKERTGVNRLAEDKKRTVTELTRTVLDGVRDLTQIESDILAVEDEERRAREEFTRLVNEQRVYQQGKVQGWKDYQVQRLGVLASMKEDKEKAEADRFQAIERGIEEEIQILKDKLAMVQSERNQVLGVIRRDHQDLVAGLDAEVKEAIAEIEKDVLEAIGAVNQTTVTKTTECEKRLAGLKEEQKNAQKAVATRDLVKKTASEAERYEAKGAALTDALEQVRGAREKLLGEIPIQGVSVKDGEVHLRDVPFHRLSGAEKIGLAFSIAERRAGPLRLVVCDGFEALDPAQMEELSRRADEAQVQLVVSRVDAGEFRVETK